MAVNKIQALLICIFSLCFFIFFPISPITVTGNSFTDLNGVPNLKTIDFNSALSDSPWPYFGHDIKNTSRSKYMGPDFDAKKWSIDFSNDSWYRDCSYVTISESGIIYVGALKKLYAVNPDGSTQWSFDINGPVASSPAIDGEGNIYAGSTDNYLYAIYPDGTKKWSFETNNSIYSSPVIGDDGTIYVGSNDTHLYAINLDGTEKWSFETNGRVFSSPAIGDDGTIYVGSSDTHLYAINLDGTEKWSFETNGLVSSSPAIGDDGTIYVGSNDTHLYAINLDGTEKWSFVTNGRVFSSPAIGDDGTIYVGSSDTHLYAINLDGTEKWSFVTNSSIYGSISSPTIDENGTIYIGSADGLYAINSDGTKKWKFYEHGRGFRTPTIGTDCTVYVGAFRPSQAYLYAIGPSGPLNIDTAVLAPPEVSVEYNEKLISIGGACNYTYTVVSGVLPPGLSLDSNEGVIVGTPIQTGSYTFSISVEDSQNNYAEKQFMVEVTKKLEIKTDKELPRGTIGNDYYISLVATGGKAPYTYEHIGGDLPINLFFSSEGKISGTISNTINFNNDIKNLHHSWAVNSAYVDNMKERLVLKSDDFRNGKAEITVNSLQNGYISFDMQNDLGCDFGYCASSYFYINGEQKEWWPRKEVSESVSYQVQEGKHTFTWEINTRSMNRGRENFLYIDNLTLPVEFLDAYNFMINVTDASGRTVNKEFEIRLDNPLIIETKKLDVGVLETPYNKQLSAQGGYGNYTWSLFSGTLPKGLNLDSDEGELYGTPVEETYGSITLAVADDSGRITYQDFILQVVEPLQIASKAMPNGLIGLPYNEAIRIEGGKGPYNFSYQGQLPTGLSLNKNTGIISGTPTGGAGLVNVEFTVIDSTYPTFQSDIKTMSIRTGSDLTIVTTAGLSNAKAGHEINLIVLEAGGGPSPYIWKHIEGNLPAGINLNSDTGEITGIPQNFGDFIFTIQATDANGDITSKEFFWHISDQLAIATSAIPDGGKDNVYSFPLKAEGGLPPYNWRIKGGTLPDGLSFDGNTGTISGIPKNRQSYSFTVEVSDSDTPAQTAEATYTIEVLDDLYIYTKTLSNSRVNEAYIQDIFAALGNPPYSWALISGSLPPGIELTSTSEKATLQGTPTVPGSYTFTIEVNDSDMPVKTVNREFVMDIYDAVNFVSPTLEYAYIGQPYSDTIEISGGIAPYHWQIVEGNLPEGLFLNNFTGHISGTTNLMAGQSNTFMVKINDSGDPVGFMEKEFTIYTIKPLKITTQNIKESTQNKTYQAIFEGEGGISPYTWSLYEGSLPEGLEINIDTGIISGIPEEYGEFDFTVRLKDSAPEANTYTKAFNLNILKDDSLPPTFKLLYKSGNGGYIQGETSQSIIKGGTGDEVKAMPNEGFHFVSWNDGRTANPRIDENVQSDITVAAEFAINQYTVTFANHDGTEIESQTVDHGSSATAPDDPARDGYTFSGWDTDFNNVTGDITVTATYAAHFEDGDGTADNPYILVNTDQIGQIRANLASYFELGADIDLDDVEDWQSIGTATDPFTGGFDGGGYVISNLVINDSHTDYAGLFGYTYSAMIVNTGLDNADITGGNNVGGLVGYAFNTTISQSYVTGSINGRDNVGGLVGYMEANAQASVSDSYANCDVTGESAVGGLIGILSAVSTLKYTYAVGTVAGDTDTGGLVGYNNDDTYENVVDSFWNKDVGPGTSQGGTGKGTAEMMRQNTFTGWDFNDTWTISDGNSYPYLQWQHEEDILPVSLVLDGSDQTLDIDFNAKIIGTGAKETLNIDPNINVDFTAGDGDRVNLPYNLEHYEITSMGNHIWFSDAAVNKVVTIIVTGTSTIGFADGTTATLEMVFTLGGPPQVHLGGAVVSSTPLDHGEVEF